MYYEAHIYASAYKLCHVKQTALACESTRSQGTVHSWAGDRHM